MKYQREVPALGESDRKGSPSPTASMATSRSTEQLMLCCVLSCLGAWLPCTGAGEASPCPVSAPRSSWGEGMLSIEIPQPQLALTTGHHLRACSPSPSFGLGLFCLSALPVQAESSSVQKQQPGSHRYGSSSRVWCLGRQKGKPSEGWSRAGVSAEP